MSVLGTFGSAKMKNAAEKETPLFLKKFGEGEEKSPGEETLHFFFRAVMEVCGR